MDSVYTFGEREVDVPPTGEACSALVKPVTPAALTWHKPAVCALQTVDDATHARLMSQVRRREGQRKRNSKPKWMYATPLVFAPLLPMTRIALRYAGCRAAGRVRCRGLAWAKAVCTRCGLTIVCEWHFRNNPKVRDRVFFGLIGVALLHGTFLLSSSFDEGSE